MMSGRLTVGEALECVLNNDCSFGEESSIDPQFSLPVAFSDDESLTPPVSPVRSSHSHSTLPFTSSGTVSLRTSVSMNTAGTGIPSLSAPPTSSARTGNYLQNHKYAQLTQHVSVISEQEKKNYTEKSNFYTRHSTGLSRQAPPSWQEITGSRDAPPSNILFHGRTGPAATFLPTSTPIQFFEKLVDETVMGIIV